MHSKPSCGIGSRSTEHIALKPCPARLVSCLTSRPHQRTVLQSAAQAEQAAAAPQPQQQLEAEPRQKQKQKPARPGQLTQTRIKRRAASWKDSSTPNTGLVGITQESRAESAAACVVADLKTAALTRIVAHNEDWLPKAVNVINIATQMMNGQYKSEQQQQQQQQAGDAADTEQAEQQQQQRVLVFQPLKVEGVLVAPPVLPEGAVALYMYTLPADHPALQAALAERAKLQADTAAAADTTSRSSDSGSDSGSSSRQRAAGTPGVVGISSSSDLSRAARCIAREVQQRGWVELSCYGGPLTTQRGIEAIMGARGVLYSWSKQDVAAVFLEFWKKDPAGLPAQQQQQQDVGEQQQQQQQRGDRQLGPLPFRCCTFLLVACAKNKPTQPVVPAARQAAGQAATNPAADVQ